MKTYHMTYHLYIITRWPYFGVKRSCVCLMFACLNKMMI